MEGEVEILTVFAEDPSPICNVPAIVHAVFMVSAVFTIQVSVVNVNTLAGVPPPPGTVFQLPAVVKGPDT